MYKKIKDTLICIMKKILDNNNINKIKSIYIVN